MRDKNTQSLIIPILAISNGTMGYLEYQSLLADHFNYDLRQCSDDDLNIFLTTAISWLSIAYFSPETPNTESEVVTGILKKITSAAEAVVGRRGRKYCQGCLVDDSDWLRVLSYDFLWRGGNFWKTYPSFARQISHHIESSHSQGFLTGNKDDIATYLHTCLERSHQGVVACEVDGCRWMSHSCETGSTCPLLPPGYNPDPANGLCLESESVEDTAVEKASSRSDEEFQRYRVWTTKIGPVQNRELSSQCDHHVNWPSKLI